MMEMSRRIGAAILLILGITVVIGWYIQSELIVQINPNWVAMQHNTALGFILCGLSLFSSGWFRKVVGLSLAFLGGMTGLQYLTGYNFGIDEFFVEHWTDTLTTNRGRMGANTCLAFFLSGCMILLPDNKKWIYLILSSFVLSLGLMSILGYLFDIKTHLWLHLSGMAMHTALGFVLFGSLKILKVWPKLKANVYFASAIFITILSFVADVSLYLGLCMGVCYLFAVLFALRAGSEKEVKAFIFICTILVILSVPLSPIGPDPQWYFIIANRVLSIMAIAVTGIIGLQLKYTENQSIVDLRSIIHSVPSGIVVIDKTGKIKFVNKHTTKMFQHSEKEFLDENVSVLMPSPYKENHQNYIQSYLKTGVRKVGEDGREVLGLKKDGAIFPMLLSIGELDVNGDVMFVGSCQEITNVKELQHLKEKLEKSNKELEEFAYVASHDLRAPLRAIANLARWIKEEIENPTGELNNYVQLMDTRITRMDNLIQGLLEYSRVGRMDIDIEQCDTDAIVQDIIEQVDISHPDVSIIKQSLPKIIANPIRLQQVFQNLIGNAVKHNGVKNCEIHVFSEEKDDVWRFTIRDNGVGIAPKYHEQIFKMFSTLVSKDKVESIGVGLSLVKKIVESFGGSVWVESEIGEGAKFVFTISKDLK